jgi:tetratricopeptide (TPR) repeat protein
LNEVLRLDPSILPARVDLAKSLLADNEAKAALDTLDGAPPQQRNALPILEQRNWALLATGDSAQARKGIDQGLAAERTPDLLLQDGILKSTAGRYAEARQSLREALAKSPADMRVLRALVGTHVAQKQLPNALQEVREHASKYPKSVEIQFFFGRLLLETGSQEEAKRAFLAAKALQPGYTPADFELARLNLRQSNWTDARQQLTSILTTQESPVARLWLGMVEESAGNHAAAIAAFRKVVDEQPKNATALNNLAYLLAEHGANADEALKFAQRAQAVEPDTARVADTLGWVLYHKGLYDMAIKQLEKASAKEAKPIHKFHLAMAYMKAGDKARGRSAFEAALRLDPKLPEATAAKELFQ